MRKKMGTGATSIISHLSRHQRPLQSSATTPVITGLDPVIHDFMAQRRRQDVGTRVKPGHDGVLNGKIGISNWSGNWSIDSWRARLPI